MKISKSVIVEKARREWFWPLTAIAIIGLLLGFSSLQRSYKTGNVSGVSQPSVYPDERYKEAARRQGYKGDEAEDIAGAAKRVCMASGAEDC